MPKNSVYFINTNKRNKTRWRIWRRYSVRQAWIWRRNIQKTLDLGLRRRCDEDWRDLVLEEVKMRWIKRSITTFSSTQEVHRLNTVVYLLSYPCNPLDGARCKYMPIHAEKKPPPRPVAVHRKCTDSQVIMWCVRGCHIPQEMRVLVITASLLSRLLIMVWNVINKKSCKRNNKHEKNKNRDRFQSINWRYLGNASPRTSLTHEI